MDSDAALTSFLQFVGAIIENVLVIGSSVRQSGNGQHDGGREQNGWEIVKETVTECVKFSARETSILLHSAWVRYGEYGFRNYIYPLLDEQKATIQSKARRRWRSIQRRLKIPPTVLESKEEEDEDISSGWNLLDWDGEQRCRHRIRSVSREGVRVDGSQGDDRHGGPGGGAHPRRLFRGPKRRRLKAQRVLPRVESGHGQVDSDRERGEEAGADDVDVVGDSGLGGVPGVGDGLGGSGESPDVEDDVVQAVGDLVFRPDSSDSICVVDGCGCSGGDRMGGDCDGRSLPVVPDPEDGGEQHMGLDEIRGGNAEQATGRTNQISTTK